MVAQAFNPISRKAEVGRSPCVRGQLCLEELVPEQLRWLQEKIYLENKTTQNYQNKPLTNNRLLCLYLKAGHPMYAWLAENSRSSCLLLPGAGIEGMRAFTLI